ncbi:MAG: hypothetical protein K2K89_09230 [Ruminococcus sp.]|nr:hypothetical protein [Ruminococcus sp.]
MRLIDADEILLNDESEYTKTMLEVDDTVKTIIKAVHNNIQTLIQEAPTIDAVPVRHGKWIANKAKEPTKLFYCSACKGVIQIGHYAYKCYYNYCPTCGAEMNGGDKNA